MQLSLFLGHLEVGSRQTGLEGPLSNCRSSIKACQPPCAHQWPRRGAPAYIHPIVQRRQGSREVPEVGRGGPGSLRPSPQAPPLYGTDCAPGPLLSSNALSQKWRLCRSPGVGGGLCPAPPQPWQLCGNLPSGQGGSSHARAATSRFRCRPRPGAACVDQLGALPLKNPPSLGPPSGRDWSWGAGKRGTQPLLWVCPGWRGKADPGAPTPRPVLSAASERRLP